MISVRNSRRDLLLLGAALCGGILRPFPATAQIQPSAPEGRPASPRPGAVTPILHPTPRTGRPMKIGVIGSGQIGSTLGELWLRAGHDVMFADRDLSVIEALAERLPRARTGSSSEAARFGKVILLAVPYSALPDIGRELARPLRGKVVMDTGNPIPSRDGEMGRAALAKGSGAATAEHLPTARVVRAFNAIRVAHIRSEAHRPGEKVGIPIAADHPQAMAMAERLVRDAGFDPVAVGGLSTASRFEMNSPALGPHTAAKLRSILALAP